MRLRNGDVMSQKMKNGSVWKCEKVKGEFNMVNASLLDVSHDIWEIKKVRRDDTCIHNEKID